ncbi:MAG: phenylalanine--tRNA ligase subunit beta [Pseudomonadales bacterium]|nr:phenylalanine--tRNA ligase subunit beta [Pseudomonadales bacterium]
MKFSEKWLRTWVDPNIGTDELCDQLTGAGLEADAVETVVDEFTGVVIGEILELHAHPNADRLSVCTVFDGSEEFSVVCGAPNARVGLKTAFARVGSELSNGLEIQPTKLRGVQSYGMLCSAKELGISDDHDGIMELSNTLSPGLELREALDLEEVSIDLDLTPNRGDCFSVRGVAREVAVLNRMSMNEPVISEVPASTETIFPVEVHAPSACPKYLGRVIEGVDISQAAPAWMVERLERSGLRSIDPVVDVTNYVLLELGQPLHAFDLASLDDRIVVRMAEEGEQLTLLDGSSIELDDESLVIAHGTGPLAIAGVMGGVKSGVTETTTDVFLECAFFSPVAIMGTGRRYGIQTDASQRYERGVDSELQGAAMERATALLIEIAGGNPGPVIEVVDETSLPQAKELTLRSARLEHLLGERIEDEEVFGILERLELRPKEVPEGWEITTPSHRFDISIEEDLVEEVCRIYGYDAIPTRTTLTAMPLKPSRRDRINPADLRNLMVHLGYNEVITYSFISPERHHLFSPDIQALVIENPMSEEQSVMRTSLIPGLIDALVSNVARQSTSIRMFEYGQCFNGDVDHLEQGFRIGAALWGLKDPENWTQSEKNVDFFDIKGDVECLVEACGRSVRFGTSARSELHPGQSADIYVDDSVVGTVGRLNPRLQRKLNVGGDVFVFECDVEPLLLKRQRRHNEVSRYPSIRRDLALVVNQAVSSESVEKLIRETVGELLVEFRLFDVYKGKGIDSIDKSLAVGLIFQDPAKTLTDSDVGALVEKAVVALEQEVGARLR